MYGIDTCNVNGVTAHTYIPAEDDFSRIRLFYVQLGQLGGTWQEIPTLFSTVYWNHYNHFHFFARLTIVICLNK